jgi:predicted RNA binding protein YcfA (HicA-like mRNA interferase family)
MPKVPRLTAADAEAILLKAGFAWLRSKGSHRIYSKGARRVVVPFHSGATLHPKIVKQVLDAIEETSTGLTPPEQCGR